MRFFAALVVCAGVGCGSRALDLAVTVGAECTVALPAGASLLYEVTTVPAEPSPPTVCGACLSVASPIADAPSLVGLLVASAPACPVAHGAALHVRLTSFASADCTVAGATRFCAQTGDLIVEDGRSDQRLDVLLSCGASCKSTGCQATSCEAQGKNCGSVPDGCGNVLDCGTCKPPEKCGGGGVINVCGR